MSKFCFNCPADLSHYTPCASGDVPTRFRFDVPAQYQGQAVEYAFGTASRGEADRGDLFMRRSDRSEEHAEPSYYRHR